MKTPLLNIVIITYNHESFIAQTIEGVLMQQVNFPIELIIAEDCSTDNTRNICVEYAKQYPDIIRLIISENNVGIVQNEHRAMVSAQGKYIAFCEGDDYWTDPLKLQKQVDFLESHPDYSVTFHRCQHYNVETHEMVDDNCGYLFADNNQLGVDITTAQFFKSWITQPLTMVYRVASFDLDVALQYNYYRDMHQIYHLLQSGKGYLFGFYGGVRLMHQGGIASLLSQEAQSKSCLQIAQELFKYNKTNETRLYYNTILLWYIHITTSKFIAIKYSFVLLFHNRDVIRFFKNLKQILCKQ